MTELSGEGRMLMQLGVLYSMIESISIDDVSWLLGYYTSKPDKKALRIEYWTADTDRLTRMINILQAGAGERVLASS